MLRLTGKQDSGSQSSRRQTSSQVSKYFVSNKSLFTKTQLVASSYQTRPSSRGNLALDYSKGYNSTLKNVTEVENKSLDKLILSVDKLKSAKIVNLSSTKKLSFKAPLKRAT